MGAIEFFTTVRGTTAEEAFRDACEDAAYEFGHSRYSGTIAAKDCDGLVLVDEGQVRSEQDAEDRARQLLGSSHPEINGKWDPTGCLELTTPDQHDRRAFLFFGVAPH